jgi:hypothetical protein
MSINNLQLSTMQKMENNFNAINKNAEITKTETEDDANLNFKKYIDEINSLMETISITHIFPENIQML